MRRLLSRVKVGVVGTPGTSTITLGAAIRSGQDGDHLTVAEAGGANGDVLPYWLIDGHNFAEGEAAYSSTGPTLARDPNEKSWNGTSYATGKLNLTSAAIVMLSPRAADIERGGRPLIASGTISSGTAQVNILAGITDEFEDYELRLANIRPSSDAALAMRLTVDAGATFEGADTSYAYGYMLGATTLSGTTSEGAKIPLTAGAAVGATAGRGLNSVIRISRPAGSFFARVMAQSMFNIAGADNNAAIATCHVSAELQNVTALINGLRLFMPTGETFAGGSWQLYGLRK